ncbi:hypothetical protein Pint_27793 [Pistacia integerrima]|uniref:Uncharacterized protein n=1 Tax=Pistacia integerrima TaxID=434235 RepID=A0ACC0YP53_9ROSI|nr:hypothetical protein Pint_27793 [Pistacia integerrima]
MGSEEGNLKSEWKEKVFQIFKEFMTRLAKLEELGAAGSKLLTGYQQGLEFLRQPPIDKTSKLIENIVKANETQRVKSYFEAGCINVHDSLQNMSKLCYIMLLEKKYCTEVRTSLLGLNDHIITAKGILNELEGLLEDVAGAIQTANECLAPLWDEDSGSGLDLQDTTDKLVSQDYMRMPFTHSCSALLACWLGTIRASFSLKNNVGLSMVRNLQISSGQYMVGQNSSPDEISTSSHLQGPEMTDLAALMGIIYTMVKQDYVMQERIVTSLNLKSLSGELESYSLMWSLRPFINDEIVHQAWRLIP